MKQFIAFLTIAVAVAGSSTPGLRARFDVGLFPSTGESFFYDLPTNVSDAKAVGWKLTRRPSGPLTQLLMYCPVDKVLCALFDDTDYVAGVQIAIAKLEFSENEFDWKTRGFTSWNTAVNGTCKQFWTIQQYFVDEEFLATSKEDRLASRNASRTLQADAVWVTGINRTLERIPIEQEELASEGVFTEQACIYWMGQHYYYNMSSTTECTAEQMFPWFPLTLHGELNAMGFMTFGQLEEVSGQRNWFERPGSIAVRLIVPDGPECLYELASDPGVVTMHIYYVDEPWTIWSC